MPLLSFYRFKDKIFYGWVVVIAGLAVGFMSYGVRNSFGVVFKSLEGEFDLTRGTTSTIFSVYMLLCCVFAVLGGWALDRYGPRMVTLITGSCTGLSLLLTSQADSLWHLYITYGLLFSMGTGAVFVAVNSTVSRWFIKKRGFVFGITTSGGSFGMFVLAPFTTYLISNFGWRAAFIILGLMAWLIVTCMSMLLRRDPGDMGLLPDGARPGEAAVSPQANSGTGQQAGRSLLEAFRTGNYWFLGFVWLLLALNVYLILTHVVPHAIDLGISPADAAVIISLIGFVGIPGRLAAGRVSDSIGRKAPAIACALLQVGTLLWLIWIRDLWILYIFAIVFGLSWGGLASQVPALIGDSFAGRSLGTIMGTLLIGWNVGAAVGPVIGGYMFDVSGNYLTAFTIGAAAMVLAAIFVALIRKGVNAEGT